MASTTQVAHDYGRQYAANLDRGGDQTRERAADLKAFLNRCNDTVNVAGSQRSWHQMSPTLILKQPLKH